MLQNALNLFYMNDKKAEVMLSSVFVASELITILRLILYQL